MTRTLLSSDKQEIVIGFDAPFCVIGERINPTGRKLLAAEMAISAASNLRPVGLIRSPITQNGASKPITISCLSEESKVRVIISLQKRRAG